jgi:hypothetical protein
MWIPNFEVATFTHIKGPNFRIDVALPSITTEISPLGTSQKSRRNRLIRLCPFAYGGGLLAPKLRNLENQSHGVESHYQSNSDCVVTR